MFSNNLISTSTDFYIEKKDYNYTRPVLPHGYRFSIIKIHIRQFEIIYTDCPPVLLLTGGDECTNNATIYATFPERRCPEERGVATLLMAVYVLFANVLLLNILIAMFR